MQTLRQAGNSIVVDVLMAIVKNIIKTQVLI
jgi:site-specific DNA-cytosine methylase